MRNDIKQKIFNSRYCISLPKEQRDFFEKITNFYKEIYDILEFDENVKVLLCYSYNIKANTIFNNYTNTKYIILDMHLFDYFIDFFYAYRDGEKYCGRYIYKYLSEIYVRRGSINDSAVLDELYHDLSKKNPKEITLQDQIYGTISVLYVFFHEVMHLKPEFADKYSFINIYNNDIQSSVSKLHLEIKGEKNKLIQESYCDFVSLLITCDVCGDFNKFGISKNDVIIVCLITILSMQFYELLENIGTNGNIINIIEGEFYDRFIILNIYALNFMFPDMNALFMDILNVFPLLLKNIGNTLKKDFGESYLKKRQVIDSFVENKKRKENNLREDIWIKVL